MIVIYLFIELAIASREANIFLMRLSISYSCFDLSQRITRLSILIYFFISGKCADTAKELGYKVFALQNGGQCFTSEDAEKSYSKYGLSDKCRDGIGGPLVSDVYTL